MIEHLNTQTVRDVYEAVVRGELARIFDILDEDVEWEVHAPPQIPFAGMRRGRNQVVEYFEVVGETTHRDEGVLDPDAFEYIAQGEKVVVIGRDRVRGKATGNHAEGWWIHVFTIREGRIVKFRQYFDTAAVQEAFTTGPGGGSGVTE
ncbi:MAG TPA: nuclear transport factor 2 family protein [Isosphaeraceae bacterium]|jgi:hypothetical protein|nr:nuclear transport factor 2 family protein [Isosphaeraceae bacterium]